MDWEAAVMNVCLLCLLTVPHEFAHAWAAVRLGDSTPEEEGRLTLYPPAHIDLLGTIIIPAAVSLFGMGFIGWGRPVNTTPSRLRYGMKGLALVALAGPASNLLLAVILAGVAVLTGKVFGPLSEFAGRGALLSIYLALFNLLPVPPLDGSKALLVARLPVAIYHEMARFGFLALIIVMTRTGLGTALWWWSVRGTETLFQWFYWQAR